jgi:hypothetical protein
MKKIALLAAASSFALAACGDSGDASEDAMAESVELPADEAMADVPDPAADLEAVEDEAAVDDATANEAADAAVDAAADAAAAAEAANDAAE